jgi:hypothetical protein
MAECNTEVRVKCVSRNQRKWPGQLERYRDLERERRTGSSVAKLGWGQRDVLWDALVTWRREIKNGNKNGFALIYIKSELIRLSEIIFSC